MIKKLLISWLLPIVIDYTIEAAKEMVSKTDNTFDDDLVNKLAENKESLIAQIKETL